MARMMLLTKRIRKDFSFSLLLKWGGVVLFSYLFVIIVLGVRLLFTVDFPVLVIFLNEYESRPCGGFATAYLYANPKSGELTFKNVYHLEAFSFGEAPYPLSLVAKQQKFWDLGVSAHREVCARAFKEAYKRAEKKEVGEVILVNFQAVESLLRLFEPFEVDGVRLTAAEIFPFLTRKVADVDRHNREALATRKSPLVDLSKGAVKKALLSPHKWYTLMHTLYQEIASGRIFVPGLSRNQAPQAKDFFIAEWNLGGGKSSRYLQKMLFISLRETAPNRWMARYQIKVFHTGGYDEPLSQVWQGGFEVRSFGKASSFFIPARLKPGENFFFQWQEPLQGSLRFFSLFAPLHETWQVFFSVESFPQQRLQSSELAVRESVGLLRFPLQGRKSLQWKMLPDTIPPFITFHEPIALEQGAQYFPESIKEGDMVLELHFNEKVRPRKDFTVTARLKDTPIPIKGIHWDASQLNLFILLAHPLPTDTPWLQLTLSGVEDLWGNGMQPQLRTVKLPPRSTPDKTDVPSH